MFILNKDYDRSELLNYVGSKQVQSGIIWGNKNTDCVLVTSGGRGGKSAGYGDLKNADGSIYYIGQGEKGDQSLTKFANTLLLRGEKTILFFSTREPNAGEVRERNNYRKLYKFEGCFEVASWDFFIPNSGKRQGNTLIKFCLVPANSVYNTLANFVYDSIINKTEKDTLENLRKKIISNSLPVKGMLSSKEYFIRSNDVIKYAKIRAEGICEKCNIPAPFIDQKNLPFLEVHHIFRLADEGPDMPENVAAICPNCHKEAHFGNDQEKIKNELAQIILSKEATFA